MTKTVTLRGCLVSQVHLPSEHLGIRRWTEDERIRTMTEAVELDKLLYTIERDLLKQFVQIRVGVYNKLIPKYGRRIQKIGNRSLWLIPKDFVPDLKADFEIEVKAKLRALERQIRAYLEANDKYLQAVKQYHKLKFNRDVTFDVPKLDERAWIELEPLNLDENELMDMVSKRIKDETDTKRKRAFEQVKADIEKEGERLRKMTVDAVIDLQKDLADTITTLTPEVIRKNPKDYIDKCEKVRVIAESLGIESLIGQEIETTKRVVEAYATTDPEKREKAVSLAMESLRTHFQLSERLTSDEVRREVARKLNREVSPRAKSLLAAIE